MDISEHKAKYNSSERNVSFDSKIWTCQWQCHEEHIWGYDWILLSNWNCSTSSMSVQEVLYYYSVHSVLLTEANNCWSSWKVQMFTSPLRMSKQSYSKKAAKYGIGTGGRSSKGADTDISCLPPLLQTILQGARPPFSADNAPCVWIQDALMLSFILLSQRCIVTNWRRRSGQRYYVQVRISWTGLVLKVYTSSP